MHLQYAERMILELIIGHGMSKKEAMVRTMSRTGNNNYVAMDALRKLGDEAVDRLSARYNRNVPSPASYPDMIEGPIELKKNMSSEKYCTFELFNSDGKLASLPASAQLGTIKLKSIYFNGVKHNVNIVVGEHCLITRYDVKELGSGNTYLASIFISRHTGQINITFRTRHTGRVEIELDDVCYSFRRIPHTQLVHELYSDIDDTIVYTGVMAKTKNDVIGIYDEVNGHGLPWRCSADMAYFREVTKGAVVIMGRSTYESLPGLLAGRKMIVLTTNVKDSLKEFLATYGNDETHSVTFIDPNEADLDSVIKGVVRLSDPKLNNSETRVVEVFVIGGVKTYLSLSDKISKMHVTEFGADIPKMDGVEEVKLTDGFLGDLLKEENLVRTVSLHNSKLDANVNIYTHK